MTKFINSANKRTPFIILDLAEKLRNAETEVKLQGVSSIPNQEKGSKKAQAQQEGARKKQNGKSDQKDDGSKISRELYSFKDQHAIQGSIRDSQRAQEVLSKEKNSQRPGKEIGNQNPLNAQYVALLNQINSQNKNLSGLTNQNHLEAANKAIIQQQLYLNSSPLFR